MNVRRVKPKNRVSLLGVLVGLVLDAVLLDTSKPLVCIPLNSSNPVLDASALLNTRVAIKVTRKTPLSLNTPIANVTLTVNHVFG